MASHAPKAVAVSSPGKALIAGGYLVLDPAHSGVVVATSARFHTVVRSVEGGEEGVLDVTVHSPQFPADPPRKYRFDAGVSEATGRREFAVLSAPPAPNKFIDHALRVALQLSHTRCTPSPDPARALHIYVLADNDFYSQSANLAARGLPTTRAALASLPAFLPPGPTLANVNKTGLGSSAALVTSLVAAVWRFVVGKLEGEVGWIHNAAQFAHCLAQGKVGSGFDVSSAAVGTHVYRRFDAKTIAGIMGDKTAPTTAALLAALDPSLATSLRTHVAPFALPPRIRLLLADVAAGSHTPSLVARVLAWRAACPKDADARWRALDDGNMRAVDLFRALERSSAGPGYDAALDVWASGMKKGDEIGYVLDELAGVLARGRTGMREMGEQAGVPIEPVEQRELLDACAGVPGVLGAGVPGAGGYDAVFVLYIDTPATTQKLDAALARFPNVTPLVCEASATGLVDETEGCGEAVGEYLRGEVGARE
ncbi:phosphomevalonate kinase [Blastocladiella emersonii ATCC 22665]|nr:phosphomevalonate kinase [Blastocladiella emersonii ATCC 22665]